MQWSAERSNLTSQNVTISNYVLGEGSFRVCLEGTFVGGNRNGQEAACKRFKPQYRIMEEEFFEKDFQIIDKVIEIATEWNSFCDHGKEILVNRGSLHYSNSGIQYLVEPLVRYFRKYTSNTGWIADNNDWQVRYLEAFTHYSYDRTGGYLIVCDIQGRYKYNRYARNKSRFELTDPATCSRRKIYGPTDLGEKGIEQFFAAHQCNEFCDNNWSRPRYPRFWFPKTHGTSMLSSAISNKLRLTSDATFRMGLNDILEEGSLSDYSDAY